MNLSSSLPLVRIKFLVLILAVIFIQSSLVVVPFEAKKAFASELTSTTSPKLKIKHASSIHAAGHSTAKKHKTGKAPKTKKVSTKKVISIGVPVLSANATSTTSSVAPFEFSGWIPYWRTATGTADVIPHLSLLSEVNPFGFTVKQSGMLNDALKIQDPSWLALKAAASASHTRYIPTVMWSDTSAIHAVLSDPSLRAAHEQSIAQAVVANGLDGIDIDYEGKLAEDQPNFSLFIQELSGIFGKDKLNKTLVCTIEAREPLEARFSGAPPATIAYANDLKVINQYCDRVRLMTYDQESADIQLNATHSTELYTPIADPAWVTKVVQYMSNDIDKKKMVIGVATYGYIYQLMPYTDGSGYSYTLTEAFNPRYATELAAKLGITPVRNSSGELSFSYVSSSTVATLPSNAFLSALAPAGTPTAYLAAAGALALVQTKHQQAPVQYLTWSDASAVNDKIALAKSLGVRGVAVFKFDGGEDQNIWNILK